MRSLLSTLAVLLSACSTGSPPALSPSPDAGSDVGVLVMAHGGGEEWNHQVAEAVEPLRTEVPTALAFGMADPLTLRAAVDSLRDRGVERVAVVRMFLSGESFLEQTNFYLGLSDTPPAHFMLMGPAASDPDARRPIAHRMQIATHPEGMLLSPQAREIALQRAETMSSAPEREAVLLLAHGMGAEAANQRVLDAIESVAVEMRARGFASVRSATLREDWPEARADAEAQVRRFVSEQTAAGRRVLVVPMRLSGFGPYADVLSGLDYEAGDGLLPHDAIARWVRETALRVGCSAGWRSDLGAC